MLKQLLAAAAALTLAAPIAAQAQEVPSYASAPADQQIQGRVTAFDGAYDLTVLDNSGYSDNIQLHDGTIINPVGLTLEPGMIVNVLGYNAGPVFDANEIDTPYAFENAVPYYLGHPWNYYGPTIALGFFFGNTGWWHGPGYGGWNRGVAYNGGPNNVTINNFASPARVAPQVPVGRDNVAPVYHAPAGNGFGSTAPHFGGTAPQTGSGSPHFGGSAPHFGAVATPATVGGSHGSHGFGGGSSHGGSSHERR
jgi:hypothetical protein